MKQHEEEVKTKPTLKPAPGKAGSLPTTKPAEKVKPSPGDASVKSDKTPTAAKKTPATAANGKPEDAKKEEDK